MWARRKLIRFGSDSPVARRRHTASVRGPRGGWEQLVARRDEVIRVEVSAAEIMVLVDAPNGEALATARR